MDHGIDLLQIKIEKAKRELGEDTLNAISAVDWRTAILSMREKHGYNFEQLGDLELETELVLCGLLSPRDYPKELESRMKISKAAADELVNEMNTLVFKKIREELVKTTERKKSFAEKRTKESEPVVEKKESLPVPEKLEIKGEVRPILAQKLSSTFQAPVVETDHSLENITKKSSIPRKPGVDPYREVPE